MTTPYESRSTKLLDAALTKLERAGAIVPGARAELRRVIEARGLSGPAGTLGKLFEELSGPMAFKYQTPGYQPSPSVLNRVLDVLPITTAGRAALAEKLSMAANQKGHVEGLVGALEEEARSRGGSFDREGETIRARGKAAREVAELVVDALDERDARDHWASDEVRTPIPRAELRARAVLEGFAPHMHSGVDLDDLARQWADVGAKSWQEAKSSVATRLKMPHFAADLTPTGHPAEIKGGDPGFEASDLELEDQAAVRAAQKELQAITGTYRM